MSRFFCSFIALLCACMTFLPRGPVFATATNCVDRAIELGRLRGSSAPSAAARVGYTCQRICPNTNAVATSCVQGGCPQSDNPLYDATVKCCLAGTGPTPLASNTCRSRVNDNGQRAITGNGSGIHLTLPTCTQSGNCQLSDIVAMAVNFAEAVMALGAALFLAIFVWAGAKYIFFAYDAGTAKSSKEMLVSASIGMIIIIGSTALVRFVRVTITGTTQDLVGANQACASRKGPNFTCLETRNMSSQEKSARECSQGDCPGTTILCCSTDSSSSSGASQNP